MTVKRIVMDIAASSVDEVAAFYKAVFDLEPMMDLGWITTLSSGQTAPVQISIASEGGGGTPVPDASIEVDDVDAVHQKVVSLGQKITYELTDEPWGVRRFHVLDPTGKLLNVLSHKG